MQEGYERAEAQDNKEVESYPALRSFVSTTPPTPRPFRCRTVWIVRLSLATTCF